MEDVKEHYDLLLERLVVLENNLTKHAHTSEDKVLFLKELCYSDKDIMYFTKQIYLDITMMRWDHFDMYIDLIEDSDMTFIVERTITGIMMEEAINEI